MEERAATELIAMGSVGKDMILSHIGSFWGYGSLESEVWFVGMEEGLGDASDEQLEGHFRAMRGKEVADIRADNRETKEHLRYFRPDAPLQRTWRYPIALYLYLKNGRVPTVEEIRNYQIARFANPKLKETAAIELMPLPAQRADEDTWRYGSLGIRGLSTRAEYAATYKPQRVQKLRELILRHRPKLVVFYSLTYLPDWTAIIGAEPERVADGMYFARAGATAYCVIPQGNARGMSYRRLFEFAEKVKTRAVGS